MISDDIEQVLVQLVTRGSYLGERFSAGRYTPAVVTPETPTWCVLDLQGGPVVLAHDPFEAARWLVRLEEEGIDPTIYEPEDLPVVLPSDADVERWRKEDAQRDLQLMFLLGY